MEFSSDSEGGPKMGPAGEQTEEEKEAIEAYMAYIENERGKMRLDFFEKIWKKFWQNKNFGPFPKKNKILAHFRKNNFFGQINFFEENESQIKIIFLTAINLVESFLKIFWQTVNFKVLKCDNCELGLCYADIVYYTFVLAKYLAEYSTLN